METSFLRMFFFFFETKKSVLNFERRPCCGRSKRMAQKHKITLVHFFTILICHGITKLSDHQSDVLQPEPQNLQFFVSFQNLFSHHFFVVDYFPPPPPPPVSSVPTTFLAVAVSEMSIWRPRLCFCWQRSMYFFCLIFLQM